MTQFLNFVFLIGESLGENLAKWWGSSDSASDSDGSKAVEMWYSESSLYDFSLNAFQYSAGHFSQLVNIFCPKYIIFTINTN